MTKVDSMHDAWHVIRNSVPEEMWPELEANTDLAMAVAEKPAVMAYYIRSESQKTIDYLTGLSNRRALRRALERELQIAFRSNRPLTLQFADVNNFKDINDTFGHPRGDEILAEIGRTYRKCSRPSDTPFRYAGDEFGLLMPDTPLERGVIVTERIRDMLPDRLSFGLVCHYPGNMDDVVGYDNIVRLADQAMYRAKGVRNGKSNICAYRDGEFGLVE